MHANLAAYQAWRLAHLMRSKRLPQKPDDLTKKKMVKAKGSGPDWRAQKAVFEMINAAFNGYDNRKPKEENEG